MGEEGVVEKDKEEEEKETEETKIKREETDKNEKEGTRGKVGFLRCLSLLVIDRNSNEKIARYLLLNGRGRDTL